MKEEKLREIAKEEMEKAIKENLDSSLIFTYIKKLEEENKELKDELEETNQRLQEIELQILEEK